MLFWITIIVVAVSAVLGFRKGIISQLGSLAAFVGALIACRLFGSIFEGIIPSASEYIASAVSFALVYTIVYVGIKLCARVLKTITHALMLGLPDRIAGALFNMFKWVMVYSIALNVYISLTDHQIDTGLPAVEKVVNFAPTVLGYVQDIAIPTKTNPAVNP